MFYVHTCVRIGNTFFYCLIANTKLFRCLDQTIPPCRSLCEDVQKSCEPFMQKHGYSWPGMMSCDQFPVDNNMCIQSQANKPPETVSVSPFKPNWSRVSSNGNVSESEDKSHNDKFYRQLLDVICKSEWGKDIYFLYCSATSFIE